MALIYDVSFDSQTRILSLLDKAGNVISSCEVPSKGNELTLTATADNSSVKLIKNGTLSNTYEVNTGSGWQSYTFGTVINLNSGDSCKWRCKSHPTTQSTSYCVQFVMTGTIEASGNCNSMLSSDFGGITSLYGYDCAFRLLFYNCTSLTKAPELPAMILTSHCYQSMFEGCTSLTQAPELPAMILTSSCYQYMFSGCSKLKEVRIAATTSGTNSLSNWLKGVAKTGNFYCDPSVDYPSGVSGIPVGWNRFVLGAEDTGTTTTMYHNGSPEIVKDGTSNYGDCYALQGWEGFKSLAQMHDLGYTLGAQTSLTMYSCDSPVSVYSCDSNVDDGFTETMYDVGNGTGYLTIAQQNENGYYLTPTPYTGLTLTATADNSSVTLKKQGSSTRRFQVNTGSGWVNYTIGTRISLNNGEKCYWRCSYQGSALSSTKHFYFTMTGTIEASGNCLSMIQTDMTTPNMIAEYSFFSLFSGCSSLTRAPELPVPNYGLIYAYHCFQSMFYWCTSLTKAPELPYTYLPTECFKGMFYGCSSLAEVRIRATTTDTNALLDWLNGVSATGDFYCDPSATIFPTDSASGIPSGWTRHDIADYPQT